MIPRTIATILSVAAFVLSLPCFSLAQSSDQPQPPCQTCDIERQVQQALRAAQQLHDAAASTAAATHTIATRRTPPPVPHDSLPPITLPPGGLSVPELSNSQPAPTRGPTPNAPDIPCADCITAIPLGYVQLLKAEWEGGFQWKPQNTITMDKGIMKVMQSAAEYAGKMMDQIWNYQRGKWGIHLSFAQTLPPGDMPMRKLTPVEVQRPNMQSVLNNQYSNAITQWANLMDGGYDPKYVPPPESDDQPPPTPDPPVSDPTTIDKVIAAFNAVYNPPLPTPLPSLIFDLSKISTSVTQTLNYAEVLRLQTLYAFHVIAATRENDRKNRNATRVLLESFADPYAITGLRGKALAEPDPNAVNPAMNWWPTHASRRLVALELDRLEKNLLTRQQLQTAQALIQAHQDVEYLRSTNEALNPLDDQIAEIQSAFEKQTHASLSFASMLPSMQ